MARSGRRSGPARSLVRLRLINACNARMLLLARADGRPLQVIAHDGHLLEAPRAAGGGPADAGPAPGPAAGARWRPQPVELLHKPYNRGAQREPSRPEPLFSVRPQGGSARASPAGTARDASSGSIRRMSRSAAASGWRWRSSPRTASSQLAPIEARLGDLELWEITNVDTQDHVFHLHTWPFQVWRRDGVALSDPGWRDTINLVPGERVEILIPFRDFAGRSVFHCHIAEHGDAGMMGIIEVRGPGSERAAAPFLDYGAAICRSG